MRFCKCQFREKCEFLVFLFFISDSTIRNHHQKNHLMWIQGFHPTPQSIIRSQKRSVLALQRNSGSFDLAKTSQWILSAYPPGKRSCVESRRPLAIPGPALCPNAHFIAKSHSHWARMEQGQFLFRTSFVIFLVLLKIYILCYFLYLFPALLLEALLSHHQIPWSRTSKWRMDPKGM